MRPRVWWFCCGWRSYLCLLDSVLHALHLNVRRVCDAHDRAILGGDA